MRIKVKNLGASERSSTAKRAAGFTLVEVMVAMALMGITFVSLLAGISCGVHTIHVARENLRATQVMVEKTETIRLNSWEQITSGTNLPTTFVEHFYPRGEQSKGITYHGALKISDFPHPANYCADMRMVTVSVVWTNFGAAHTRQMITYVARNGMQNYVF